MKSAVRVSMSITAIATVLLAACNRDQAQGIEPKDPNEQDRSGTTTLTGASWVSNNGAIDRIVASRCAREVMCSNVGAAKHFTSSEVCAREIRTKLNDELNASECPNGIDRKELDECLDAIRNESCSNPIESIGRLAACRTSDLCMKTPAPRR